MSDARSMYSLSACVDPRASTLVWRGLESYGFVPVHQGSQALAPGLTHEMSFKRLGVARVAMRLVVVSAAAVRPNISTRQGERRGTVDCTSPLPSMRPSSVTLAVAEPEPVIDIP